MHQNYWVPTDKVVIKTDIDMLFLDILNIFFELFTECGNFVRYENNLKDG